MNGLKNVTSHRYFFLFKFATCCLCSQYTSQQVSKLLLELEEAQTFSFLQQAAEEEEQKEKAEDIRRLISPSFGNNTDNTRFRNVNIEINI